MAEPVAPDADGETQPDSSLPNEGMSLGSGMRDLAVLLALPAMWVGHDPTYIASNLLQLLTSLLHLESAYVRFSDPAGGTALVYWHPSGPKIPVGFESMFSIKPSQDRGVVTTSPEGPVVEGTIHVARVYPALPGEDGLVLVGSSRSDFPTPMELHLLRTAVGQASISIRSARMLADERAGRAKAEAALQDRNHLLEVLSEKLALASDELAAYSANARAMATGATADRLSMLSESESAPHAHNSSSELSESAAGTIPVQLTRRETEVLGLLAQGLSNRKIATELWLSERTVERHITSLYARIGVRRRSEATRFALLYGLAEALPADS